MRKSEITTKRTPAQIKAAMAENDAAIATLDSRLADVDARGSAAAARADGIATETLGMLRANGIKYVEASLTPAQLQKALAGQPAAIQDQFERYNAGLEKAERERDGLASERKGLTAQRERLTALGQELVAELDQANHARILDMAGRAERADGYTPDDSSANRARSSTMLATHNPRDLRSAALGTIERHAGATGALTNAAATRLERVVRSEPSPLHARYLAAVGSPEYLSGWAAVMADPEKAAIELSAAERAALREGREALAAINLMALGTTDVDPGWPLPLQVDPTLIIVGEGVADDLRQLATVRQIVGKSLSVVTAAQVSGGYGAEGTDVADGTPDPQPVTIKAQRGTAFVRLTYELVADLIGSVSELGRLFADAKRNIEAEKFAVGTGVNEPEGIVTGLTPMGGSPADPDDLRAAQSALGPRYQGNARWLADLTEINAISTFVASADAAEPQIFDAQGNLLRKPVAEINDLGGGRVVYGDVRAGFTIVDRMGMSLEPTGVTFNKSTGVPDGHRGFLAIWRNGSKVVDEAALRLLGSAVVVGGSGSGD